MKAVKCICFRLGVRLATAVEPFALIFLDDPFAPLVAPLASPLRVFLFAI